MTSPAGDGKTANHFLQCIFYREGGSFNRRSYKGRGLWSMGLHYRFVWKNQLSSEPFTTIRDPIKIFCNPTKRLEIWQKDVKIIKASFSKENCGQ